MSSATLTRTKGKNFLTPAEMARFLEASRAGRNGVRNHCMMLLAYRHGLRVSELVGIRMADLDMAASRLYVRRAKGSLSSEQPMAGDELRAVRAWLRERPASAGDLLFCSERGAIICRAVNYICLVAGESAGLPRVNPHMLRHSCGYYLANKGCDTRLIQSWLGHKSISNTVIYTQLCAKRFEGLWE